MCGKRFRKVPHLRGMSVFTGFFRAGGARGSAGGSALKHGGPPLVPHSAIGRDLARL
jgi:hypothetical protein